MAQTPNATPSGKTIRAETIWERLRSILGSEVDSDSATDEFIGDAQAVRAFADVLNKSDQFKGDHFSLEPGHLAGCTTIGCIATAIVAWYQRHGWQVVI